MTDGKTPATLKALYQEGRSLLAAAFADDNATPAREAALLLEQIFSLPRGGVALEGHRPADPTLGRLYIELVQRRGAGEPLQYLLGRWEFYSLPFFVGPGVLIPRPETELAVDTALTLLHGNEAPVIADLCAGSGCIAVALAKNLPQSLVYAVEKSRHAMGYLQRNRALNQAENIRAVWGDVFCPAACLPRGEALDLVISNPPYIATRQLPGLQPEVRREPQMALDGGCDGLDFYRAIPPLYREWLAPGGALVLEIGYDQGQAVVELLKSSRYKEVTLLQDLSGCDRVVWGRRG